MFAITLLWKYDLKTHHQDHHIKKLYILVCACQAAVFLLGVSSSSHSSCKNSFPAYAHKSPSTGQQLLAGGGAELAQEVQRIAVLSWEGVQQEMHHAMCLCCTKAGNSSKSQLELLNFSRAAAQ